MSKPTSTTQTNAHPTAADVAEAERILDAARNAETARAEAEQKEHERRDVAAAVERLAGYDHTRYQAEAREAWASFIRAFEETPAFAALADAQAAKWRAHRAAHAAVSDRTTIARARGDELPRPYDGTPPEAIGVHTILSVLEAMLLERINADEERTHQAHLDALARSLTPEQARAADAHLAAGRADKEEPQPTSIDVTDMSEAERAELGLPTGGLPPRDPDGVRRRYAAPTHLGG